MGMARNREGELFVTDNQGNYNPFNELNHVRKGRILALSTRWKSKTAISRRRWTSRRSIFRIRGRGASMAFAFWKRP